jgi:hypothetical protein
MMGSVAFGVIMLALGSAAILGIVGTSYPPVEYWTQNLIDGRTHHLVAIVPDEGGGVRAVLTESFPGGRGDCLEHRDLVISEMRRIGEQGPSAAEASRIWFAERTMYCLANPGTH